MVPRSPRGECHLRIRDFARIHQVILKRGTGEGRGLGLGDILYQALGDGNLGTFNVSLEENVKE